MDDANRQTNAANILAPGLIGAAAARGKAASAKLGLTRAQRVRATDDFKRVYATKKAVRGAELTVAYAPNGLSWSRLGLSVSTAHGNAVVRNRIKRMFRAAFRAMKDALPPGFDYVLIPKKGFSGWTVGSVRGELEKAGKKVR